MRLFPALACVLCSGCLTMVDGVPASAGLSFDGGAWDGGGARGDLLLSLKNVDVWKNTMVRLKVKLDGGTLGAAETLNAAGINDVVLRVPGVLEAGRRYSVDFFFDLDGDGACAPCSGPGQEPAWRAEVLGTGADVSLTPSVAAPFVDISPF